MQDSKPGDGDAPGSIEGGEKTDTPSSPSRAHLLHRKEVPPNTLSLTHFEFQFLTQTLTTSQSAQNALPAIFASNQLQKKVQGCFLETDWFSAHGAHLPELDVLWVMQIFLTNELHSTPP